jgi:hypothetical protein
MANGQSTNRTIWRVNSDVAAVSVSLRSFLFSLPVNEPTNARGVSRRSTRKYARALASGPTMKHLSARNDNDTKVENTLEPACLPAWLSASPPPPPPLPHFAALFSLSFASLRDLRWFRSVPFQWRIARLGGSD